jgi:flavin-dependent dehydrogenase
VAGNEFILYTQQVGWRLDRCRFDRMMLAAGATKAVVLPASVTGVALSGQHWTLRIGNDAVRSRFLVDASGRAANVSRRVGLRTTGVDRLIGCFATVPDSGAAMRDTLIEAVPEGWWFATRLPDGRHVLGCLTDADLLRRLDLRRAAGWLDRLGATRFARLHWSGDPPERAPRLVAAGSRQLRGTVQGPFLAVGDALASFDPISGQGIVNALRSGVFAAYAAADWLRGDTGGIERYRSLAEREYARYRRILRDYYRDEMRWPNAPFWRRRHAADAGAGDRIGRNRT